MRTMAANVFEDIYKLMKISVFGGTKENIGNWVDVCLVSVGGKCVKLVALRNFKYRSVFTENLSDIRMNRICIKFSKSIYVGLRILDLSVTLMYSVHCGTMKTKYGDHGKVMTTNCV
jgi:hypothetical protein